MSELNNDYKEVCKAINLEIKKAAKIMKNVNALAKKAGIKSLNGIDEYDNDLDDEDPDDHAKIELLYDIAEMINITPLFDEIDKAGWRTSSIGC